MGGGGGRPDRATMYLMVMSASAPRHPTISDGNQRRGVQLNAPPSICAADALVSLQLHFRTDN